MICSNCGARSALEAGQTGADCAHCGARMVPTSEHLAEAEEATGIAALEARARRVRLERRRMLGGMLGLAQGDFLATMAVAPGQMHALARRVGGTYSQRSLERLRWFDNHWYDRISAQRLCAPCFYGFVQCHVGALPCLIDFQPLLGGGGTHDPRGSMKLYIWIGAWIPGLSDDPSRSPRWPTNATPLLSDLAASGFEVELGVAGLAASAQSRAIDTMLDQGSFELLQTKLLVLQKLAATLVASPPPVISYTEASTPVTVPGLIAASLRATIARLRG